MGVPAFLFTRDPQITNTPRGARQLLRVDNLTFDAAMQLTPGLVQVLPRGWISFPRDAVLLMIGNTQELLNAFAAVWNQGRGITAIDTSGCMSASKPGLRDTGSIARCRRSGMTAWWLLRR
jgi:hypothetical protein